MTINILLATTSTDAGIKIMQEVENFFEKTNNELVVHLACTERGVRRFTQCITPQIIVVDKRIPKNPGELVEWCIKNGGNPHIFFTPHNYSVGNKRLEINVSKTVRKLREAVDGIIRQVKVGCG